MRLKLILMIIGAIMIVSACTTTQKIEPTGDTDVPEPTGNTVGASTEPEVKVVTINSFDFGFTVDGPEINKGDKVKIVFTSTEGTHGLAIPGLNVDLRPVAAGEEMSMEFTADQSGSFDYFCNVPCGTGHKSMKGTLTVN